LPVTIEECNIGGLCEELTSIFTEYQNRLGKQEIRFNLQSLCAPSKLIILTDKLKLKQILINLINNAFKFTDEGTITCGCKLSEKQTLLFYVTDTGIGIPDDKHQEIFERFTQLNQSERKNMGGTGLGLSIVKGLVNLLGGEMFLESEPGKGSTFSFSIPYITTEPIKYGVSVMDTPAKKNLSGKTILIVEDDQYNTDYLKEILTGLKLNILIAENGKEAVALAITQTIDLVLMDIRLPDITGYEATHQIREHKPKLKIIAQTAYASHDEKQKAIAAGCDDYLSKPTRKDLLLAMLYKHFSDGI
jgi:CheY-like chemotaxis protein